MNSGRTARDKMVWLQIREAGEQDRSKEALCDGIKTQSYAQCGVRGESSQ